MPDDFIVVVVYNIIRVHVAAPLVLLYLKIPLGVPIGTYSEWNF
jgi:hypothetical protein